MHWLPGHTAHQWDFHTKMKSQKITVGSSRLKVKKARTKAQHHRGLMFVDDLKEDEGMLFSYSKEKFLSFWMKNTKLRLSIAFIDKNYKILQIEKLTPLSEKSVLSKSPAKYALEVNQGWFIKNNIKIGDKIKINCNKVVKISVKK